MLNAYDHGWQCGNDGAFFEQVLNSEELLEFWEWLVRQGAFKHHQKEQFLKGYVRGSKGEPK